MVVYADNNGKPAASPVAVSDEVVETSGAVAGWVTFSFHGEKLPPGGYWIGFWVGGWGNSNHGHFYYDKIGSSTSSYTRVAIRTARPGTRAHRVGRGTSTSE